MDQRRYYVLGVGSKQGDSLGATTGEQGPYSLEELREALNQGSIVGGDQVRTGLGTMIGTVQDIVTGAGAAAPGPESSGSRPSLLGAPWVISITILVLIVFAGFMVTRQVEAQSVGARIPPTPISAAPPFTSDAARGPTPISTRTTVTIAPKPPAVPTTGGVQAVNPGALQLTAGEAKLQGKLRCSGAPGTTAYIDQWLDPQDQVSWNATFTSAGRHEVLLEYACPADMAGSQYRITVGPRSLANRTESTGDEQTYALKFAGFIHINQPGDMTISIRRIDKRSSTLMRLRRIVLTAK